MFMNPRSPLPFCDFHLIVWRLHSCSLHHKKYFLSAKCVRFLLGRPYFLLYYYRPQYICFLFEALLLPFSVLNVVGTCSLLEMSRFMTSDLIVEVLQIRSVCTFLIYLSNRSNKNFLKLTNHINFCFLAVMLLENVSFNQE